MPPCPAMQPLRTGRDVLMTAERSHVPVLLDRVVELLADAPAGTIVDGTLGAGGHAAAVLEERLARHGRAHLVGIDRDAEALELARAHLAARFQGDVDLEFVHARFDEVDAALDRLGIGQVAGILVDLGISSMHVDQPERGFSYRAEGPLDMRMDRSQELTAADVVNDWPVGELVRVLEAYGEEPHARRIARALVEHRPFTTTTQLAAVVRAAIPAAARRRGAHPATRTFQALRIAVNGEIDALETALPSLLDRLQVGGVMVALSYHSLEDRLVKRSFADAATGCICPPDLPVCTCGRVPNFAHVVRRPERPSDDEATENPRSRSARLRAIRRIDTQETP